MSFNDAIGAALQAMHSGVGETVLYTAPGAETGVEVLAVPIGSDTERTFGSSTVQSDVTVFEILVSAIATPKRKAVIRYRGKDYAVKNFKFADPDELIHEVECYPLEGE